MFQTSCDYGHKIENNHANQIVGLKNEKITLSHKQMAGKFHIEDNQLSYLYRRVTSLMTTNCI